MNNSRSGAYPLFIISEHYALKTVNKFGIMRYTVIFA
jgi:hypothetical protein